MIFKSLPLHLDLSPVLTTGIQLNLKILKQRNFIYKKNLKKSRAVACLRLWGQALSSELQCLFLYLPIDHPAPTQLFYIK